MHVQSDGVLRVQVERMSKVFLICRDGGDEETKHFPANTASWPRMPTKNLQKHRVQANVRGESRLSGSAVDPVSKLTRSGVPQ